MSRLSVEVARTGRTTLDQVANTHLIKALVEPYVREELGREYRDRFEPRFLPLPAGGQHEFDAVSSTSEVVAAIKSNSGLTSGGKRPQAKILSCYAELYYLAQIDAPRRLLVLTNPEFFEIFERDSQGRLVPGLELKLVTLSEEMQRQVDEVSRAASQEMAASRAVADEVADLVVTGDLPEPMA